jgi:hypothetical protein
MLIHDAPVPPGDAPSAHAVTGTATRISRRRSAAHALAGVAGWLLFAALWAWQALAGVPSDWRIAILAIGTGLAAAFALCLGWVRWNRGIYRRRHRRTEPIRRTVSFDRDALGRPIDAAPVDWLREAAIVEVEIDSDDVKSYRPVETAAGRAVLAGLRRAS